MINEKATLFPNGVNSGYLMDFDDALESTEPTFLGEINFEGVFSGSNILDQLNSFRDLSKIYF
jgi:hypothetical protein